MTFPSGAYHNAQPGPSRPTCLSHDPVPKPRKRRKLQFTNELRTNIPRYNPDGTETVEYLHYQSTARLKRKWESIFERFKDAHLQEQDEIYLGNRANGEPIVVVKDRGSLRNLRQSMEFGVFIKDEELQGWRERPEVKEIADAYADDDVFAENLDPTRDFGRVGQRRQMMAESSSEDDKDEDDPAANDPDLREFLQAEARRKAMLGSNHNDEEEDEDEDEVIDFRNPTWSDASSYQHSVAASPKPPALPIAKSNPSSTTIRASLNPPELVTSSEEDDSDTDVVTIHSDSDEELIDSIRTKRQNIEELLMCTTPFETLPYNDIFGLPDLLKLSDNSSRLYIDLVSDDEEVLEVAKPSTDRDTRVVQVENHAGRTSLLSGDKMVQGAGSPFDFEAEGNDSKVTVVYSDQAAELATSYASSLVAHPASSQASDLFSSQASSVIQHASPQPPGMIAPGTSPTARTLLPHILSSPSLVNLVSSQPSHRHAAAAIRSSPPVIDLVSSQGSHPKMSQSSSSMPPPVSTPTRNRSSPNGVHTFQSSLHAEQLTPPHTLGIEASLPSSLVARNVSTPIRAIVASPKIPLRHDETWQQFTRSHSQFKTPGQSIDHDTIIEHTPSTPTPSMVSSKHQDSHSLSLFKSADSASKEKQRRRSSSKFDESSQGKQPRAHGKKRNKIKCGGSGKCKKTFCLFCA
ncbi:uncharacterized protein MEPE_05718 [Melanopsichium pennsylvanicum]|uniref:Uncharacterized protein n=2 Tax=Melanopsichium pennsylvanicum TaxID=63383 RepID=A0AAJ4XTN8_9BASI|nr:conserved hypothetical protein [Melanopsichium pennsylvanicum 4]SNX87008.1 uncharacterized protein MEPE_05718 [Melanopsichium pennsylvanicum]